MEMGTLQGISRADLEAMINWGRVVVAEGLKTGRFNVDPWLAEVEPLLADSLELEHQRDLNTWWSTLFRRPAPNVALDASLEILSILESIENGYSMKS